jgi:GPN-loop GTPase
MEDKYKFFRLVPFHFLFPYMVDFTHALKKIFFFGSGVLSAMSAMVNLEIPWINVMSKMDLVTNDSDDPAGGARNGVRSRKDIARCERCLVILRYASNMGYSGYLDVYRYLDPDPLLLANAYGDRRTANTSNPRFHALNQAIVQLVSNLSNYVCI